MSAESGAVAPYQCALVQFQCLSTASVTVVIFCVPSTGGGTRRRDGVFSHVRQWRRWRWGLPLGPIQRGSRRSWGLGEAPPSGELAQGSSAGPEELAVRAPLQCLPFRTGEAQSVRTDQPVCASGEHKTTRGLWNMTSSYHCMRVAPPHTVLYECSDTKSDRKYNR